MFSVVEHNVREDRREKRIRIRIRIRIFISFQQLNATCKTFKAHDDRAVHCVWFDVVPASFPSRTPVHVIPHISWLFNIVRGFTTLNTAFSWGLCLSYNRHWARRGTTGGEGGRNIYFSECNSSLFTLIPLHGLNTSSTAASHSLLIGPLTTKRALSASLLFWNKQYIDRYYSDCGVKYHMGTRRLWRCGDAWKIWPWLVAMIWGLMLSKENFTKHNVSWTCQLFRAGRVDGRTPGGRRNGNRHYIPLGRTLLLSATSPVVSLVTLATVKPDRCMMATINSILF